MNRIVERFAKLKEQRQKGFVAYIGAGDPNLAATGRLALALDRAGVDVLELGIPFSDPLADGVVNQLAAQRGLESGTTPQGVLEMVRQLRATSQVPVLTSTPCPGPPTRNSTSVLRTTRTHAALCPTAS